MYPVKTATCRLFYCAITDILFVIKELRAFVLLRLKQKSHGLQLQE